MNAITIQEQKDLDQAAIVMAWNKRLMSTLGLWPRSRNNLLFSINFGYFSILMALEYLDLFLFIDNLEHVIMNLTENMAFTQIFVRMSMLWMHNDQLGWVIENAIKDFDIEKYESSKEKNVFVAYNNKSKIFMKLLMTFVALTATSYYMTPLFILLGSGFPTIMGENGTEVIYLLPYRFHFFYEIENVQSYAIAYAIELPFVFVSGLGQSAADCIMVTLVFHICGQLSVLALRINDIETNPQKCSEEIRNVIETHTRLLRMGKAIEEAFSLTLLAHLFGATALLCILGYQILMNFANGEKSVLITFLIFQFLVLLILYAHCVVGESLVTESSKVCEAFYDCKWYDMPIASAKMIILCIARSQKPLCLTAGKMTQFCLKTLTDAVKTSMGYLSVLRSFL